MSTGCSREPTVRKLKADLYQATQRINELDSFARRAGGILAMACAAHPDTLKARELAPLVEEYERLFPADDSLEF